MNNTNTHKPFIIGKIFNKPEHAYSLLNGTVYINPLSSFGVKNLFDKKEEMKNEARGDLNEGLTSNVNARMPVPSIPVRFFQDIGGIPTDADSLGEIDTHYLIENISCFTALFFDESHGELKKLNDKLRTFTDGNEGYAIIIFDVQEYLRRIMTALSESLGSPYWVAYGLVDYSFDKQNNTQTDEFTKERSFAYQQEFRIAINLQNEDVRIRARSNILVFDASNGTIKINIGSIKDIAFVLPVEDYINLDFPSEYSAKKTERPKSIVPFYPPVRNETSYICPLIRTDDGIFITENSMYPVVRYPNAYRINMRRLEETKSMMLSSDSFFLEMLTLYCSRILDIFKSINDHSKMEQVLTAFLKYLMIINVSSCAGMSWKFIDGYVHHEYSDVDLHDPDLQDYNCYQTVKRKILPPPPTDYAVLLTLSNQTEFEEYEYNGRKYIRIELARDGILPSGKEVKKGENFWIEVSKVRFRGY